MDPGKKPEAKGRRELSHQENAAGGCRSQSLFLQKHLLMPLYVETLWIFSLKNNGHIFQSYWALLGPIWEDQNCRPWPPSITPGWKQASLQSTVQDERLNNGLSWRQTETTCSKGRCFWHQASAQTTFPFFIDFCFQQWSWSNSKLGLLWTLQTQEI